ncbi:hypothetical protein ACFLRY_05745 [Bacteroidota bacterium]
MKTDLLFDYIKLRAQIEGVEFDLPQREFFEHNFDIGIRHFFGVLVDENCYPIKDEQEPKTHPDLLISFIKNRSISLN